MSKSVYQNQINIVNESVLYEVLPTWSDVKPADVAHRLREKARWMEAPLDVCRIPLRANATAVFKLVESDDFSAMDRWNYELVGIEELVFHRIR